MTFHTLGIVRNLSPREIRALLRDLLEAGWNVACAYRTDDVTLFRVGLLT